MTVLRWLGGEHLARLTEPGVWHDRRERIRHQLDWLLDLHPSERRADRDAMDALTHMVVHELGRLQDPAPGDLAARTRAFVRANLQRRLTLDDLAAVAGLSKYHFARRLKQITGHAPMRLVNQIRAEVAHHLLLQTRLPLDAIAAEVGLADASHLSHLFRRLTGRSPGSVRRQV
jgi:AraC-like DNA-binding protein